MKKIKLDPATLEALAELICGDDGPVYRTGWKLPIFFRNAGLSCPDHDGSTRKWWTLSRLSEYNENPRDIEKILKRLADPKEYHGNRKLLNKAINKLNDILWTEGLKIELKGLKPIIKKISIQEIDIQIEETEKEFPIKNLSHLVGEELETILLDRYKELLICLKNGAYLSAIIMMGSILEGLLYEIISQNPEEANRSKMAPKDRSGRVKKFKDWKLSDMINVAHDLGWIKAEIKDFSDVLRDYRNMVHPKHQKEKKIKPDLDTCKICWNVVLAAINDLNEVFKK